MKQPNAHRALLMATAIACTVGGVAAQPADTQGTVAFEDGGPIPAGHLKISVEDPATSNVRRSLAETRIEVDGKSKTITFALPGSAAPETQEIVARLERADGWLLARGSAQLTADAPVHITLYRAIY